MQRIGGGLGKPTVAGTRNNTRSLSLREAGGCLQQDTLPPSVTHASCSCHRRPPPAPLPGYRGAVTARGWGGESPALRAPVLAPGSSYIVCLLYAPSWEEGGDEGHREGDYHALEH